MAATPTPDAPNGFYLIDSKLGVHLYRKDYKSGNPDYLQVIDLSQGASLKFLHGPITELRPSKGVYGGADPKMHSLSLENYWGQVKTVSDTAFCITNGSFFYMLEYPTRLAFPLKVDGIVVTDGWAIEQYPGQKLMLELWQDQADIRELRPESLYSSDAPNIIAGLTEQANKRAKWAVGRTFVGIDDRNGDGSYETVYILNTLTARQIEVAATLRNIGADMVMMLDGGGSTQLLCNSGWHIKSERPIPQAIVVVAASPPAVDTWLVNYPSLPILLEGENLNLTLEIKNTGVEKWTPEQTHLVLERSHLSPQMILTFGKEILPGETISNTQTLAAFTKLGVYNLQIQWGILHDEQLYPGETIATQVIVLPAELSDREEDLRKELKAWAKERPKDFDRLVRKWIAEQIQMKQSTPTLPSPIRDGVEINNMFWVPLLMLPILLVLGIAFSQLNRNIQ